MHDRITVFGIDFTSAPSTRKPITCVRARFTGDALSVEDLVHMHDFIAFESLLATPGSWVAGMDFPFGQARRLVENIGWPNTWAGYVGEVSMLDRTAFRNVLEDYKRDRVPGDKHHKRACDVLTRSQSPQTLYGTPGADDLDALICAVQAAWGYSQADGRYGAPDNLDRLEGWISDPAPGAAINSY